MFQLVRKYEFVPDAAGVMYQPRAYGEVQPDGSWDGWLVFFPILTGVVVATDRETTQNSYADLVRWSARLTPAYLEVALERALRLQLEPAFRPRFAELSELDSDEELELAAAEARTDAEEAELEAEAHESEAAAARAEARERMNDAHAIERDLTGAGGRRRTDRF